MEEHFIFKRRTDTDLTGGLEHMWQDEDMRAALLEFADHCHEATAHEYCVQGLPTVTIPAYVLRTFLYWFKYSDAETLLEEREQILANQVFEEAKKAARE